MAVQVNAMNIFSRCVVSSEALPHPVADHIIQAE